MLHPFRHLLALLLATLAAPLPAAPPPATGERARFEAVAGEPVPDVAFFRIHQWLPIDEYALILWLGREEPYLITLRHRCFGLTKETALRFVEYQRPGRNRLRARWSQVLLWDGRTCRLSSIRPIDPAHLRVDGDTPPGSISDVLANPDPRRFEPLAPVASRPPHRPEGIAIPPQGVTLAARVDEQGRVREVSVERSSGEPLMDQAAVAAVHGWRFEAHRPGEPERPVWVRIDVEFDSD